MKSFAGARCPTCGHPLDVEVGAGSTECRSCQTRYPSLGGLPVLLPEPLAHLRLWRDQLASLRDRARATCQAFELAAGTAALPGQKRQLFGWRDAVRMQLDDLSAILTPLLGASGEARGVLPRGVVEYQALLFRDWAWPRVGHGETQASFSVLAELLDGRALGRQLVLGAGACGLAYELHRRCAASQTVALDIDPYLLLVAEQIVRGNSIQLTEASVTALTPGEQSRRWELAAPHGALGPEAFSLIFADGVEPPFGPASFDSVVTPWFIDQVPRDLPALVAALARLLVPGGVWINHGPLLYPERLGFEARYSSEAVVELASQAGFELLAEKRESMPYLVSPLSGRGRLEHVWSFVARRR
jgi:hypothetical protein